MKDDEHNLSFLGVYFSRYFTRNEDLVKMEKKENQIELKQEINDYFPSFLVVHHFQPNCTEELLYFAVKLKTKF